MKIITITILILVVAALALVVGPCVYFNFLKQPDTGLPGVPGVDEATHSFYIENTGGMIISSDYEQHGEVKGRRTFVLHGFWEMRGNKFKYVPTDVTLNEQSFGKITVTRRTK